MSPPTRRIILLRASRDTLVLVACTVGMTLALAYAVHQRPTPVAARPEQQVWAGQLTEVAPEAAAPAAIEPMTSASLVVPKAALALPPAQPASSAPRATKPLPCDAQPCPARSAAPLPPARQKLAAVDAEPPKANPAPAQAPISKSTQTVKEHEKRFALSDLNPLPHLPDAVRRPFSYAGTKISGWIDRF